MRLEGGPLSHANSQSAFVFLVHEKREGGIAFDVGLAVRDYCQTLDLTDIATTWTKTAGVKNKAQVLVFAALKKLRET